MRRRFGAPVRGRERRSARIWLCAIALLVMLGSAVAGAASDRKPRLPGAPTGASSTAQLLDAREAEAQRAARLRTPAARAARVRSRSAYSKFGRGASLRLARRSFDEIFEAPIWRAYPGTA
jgi:hypothetical protein